jgi:lysophospholipase L1-like esterase
MSASDRSWTIAPSLAWFGVSLLVGVVVLDGGVGALADRLTARREADKATSAGPVFSGPPVVVAEADSQEAEPAPALPAPTPGGRDIGALADTCIDGTPAACKRWAMDGFYRAADDAKRGGLGRAVRVSWYGDSVVATDAIPGRLRARLQGELGDGGPGFVYIVPPHRFCNHESVTRTSSGTWATYAISTIQIADGLYGPGGTTTQAVEGAHASIKLVAGKVTNVELYALGQPHGGSVVVRADGAEIARADTGAEAKQTAFATGTVAEGASKFEIETRGRVRLFGIDLENATGAVVDNLGIVSVNVKSMANNDVAHWRAELGHRGADLLMIMIGANEAEWLSPGDKDTKDYQAHYEQILEPLRKGRPEASCLVVSPTDQAEEHDGGYRSRPVMPLLVAAQRKAAVAQGCAFYSTYDWMGGKGSASKWFKKGLVSSDFQHLSKKGANRMADAVFDALIGGYQRYARK